MKMIGMFWERFMSFGKTIHDLISFSALTYDPFIGPITALDKMLKNKTKNEKWSINEQHNFMKE